jgi:hypothetical protein
VDQSALPPALERASLSELLDLQNGYASSIATFKGRADAVKAELARRFAASAAESLKQKGKTHGSGKLELQDRLAVKYDVKQEVKWDSPALMAIAQTLPWERVAAIFKIEFSVSETVYKGIAAVAPELREKIDAARTTKIKEPSLALVRED